MPRATRLLAVLIALFATVAACDDDSGGENPVDTTTAGDTTGGSDVSPGDTSAPDSSTPDTSEDATSEPDQVADTTQEGDTSLEDVADASAEDTTTEDTVEDTTEDVMQGLPDGPSSERHTARPLGSTDAAQGYYEYLPVGYGDGTARPLLLFFHGIGENGNGTTDLDDVLAGGPPRYIARDQWPSDRPFIVLSPQHPGDGCHTAAEIDAMLDHAIANYDVDRSRIYLTGLSCGAIGVWNYLGAHTGERVAAAVPIAGDGRSAWNRAGCDLGQVALWAFHGDADDVVSVSGTNVPIDNLLADCPAPPRKEVLKTIYEGVTHDSWSRTYSGSAGHDIYTWLLGHQR